MLTVVTTGTLDKERKSLQLTGKLDKLHYIFWVIRVKLMQTVHRPSTDSLDTEIPLRKKCMLSLKDTIIQIVLRFVLR